MEKALKCPYKSYKKAKKCPHAVGGPRGGKKKSYCGFLISADIKPVGLCPVNGMDACAMQMEHWRPEDYVSPGTGENNSGKGTIGIGIYLIN